MPTQLSDSLLTKMYLTFIVLEGDTNKTAVACDVAEQLVIEQAQRENWHDRLETTKRLASDSRGPAEIERLLNRAGTYVQAMRLRRIIDVVLNELEQRATNSKSILDAFTFTDKEGNHRIDLKPIAELAAAAQKLSAVAFSAMSDTAGERLKRLEGSLERQDDALALGARVLSALTNIPAVAGNSELVALESVRKAIESPDKV